MAGAACKVIINNGVQGLIKSIETILTNSDIHQERISYDDRMVLIQKLADVDLASYNECVQAPIGGVAGILVELEKYGIVTDEVWQVFRQPG